MAWRPRPSVVATLRYHFSMPTVDLLAIFAHPDDAELLAGGTLAAAAAQGHRVGILDLTRGEMGSRGTPEIRAAEAQEAAAVLGVAHRVSAGLPDGHLDASSDAMRRVVVSHLRAFRPRLVITHALVGRHPDHRNAALLVRDACFLGGLANYPGDGERHRPDRLCHAIGYREDHQKPTFVVDTSRHFETKLAAMRCFRSQWDDRMLEAGEVQRNGLPFFELVRVQDAHAGSLIRAAYGEPFWTEETVRLTGPLALLDG